MWCIPGVIHSLFLASPCSVPWPHSLWIVLAGLTWIFCMCNGSIFHFSIIVSSSPSGVLAAHQYI